MSSKIRDFVEAALSAAMLAGAAIPMIAVAGAAHAQEITVKVGDLDLSNPAAMSTLNARVWTASQAICRERADAGEATPNAQVCFKAVRQEVFDKLAPAQQSDIRTAAQSSAAAVG